MLVSSQPSQPSPGIGCDRPCDWVAWSLSRAAVIHVVACRAATLGPDRLVGIGYPRDHRAALGVSNGADRAIALAWPGRLRAPWP